MSLESLKRKSASMVTTKEVHGDSYSFRKLSAGCFLELQKQKESFSCDADEFIALLKKTLCNESGDLDCDSDEGESLLKKMPIDTLVALGQASFEWSLGKQDEGKNLQPLSDSVSSSA